MTTFELERENRGLRERIEDLEHQIASLEQWLKQNELLLASYESETPHDCTLCMGKCS